MSQELFEVIWDRGEEAAPPAAAPPPTPFKPPISFVLAPVVVVVVFGLAVMLFARRAPEPPREPEPVCASYASELGQVRTLIEQGKPELAVGITDLTLSSRQPQPCPEDNLARLALTSLRYRAAYSLALTIPDRSDPQAGSRALERWQEAEAKAEAQGLPREQRISAMTTHTEATNSGLWLLARQAFLRAWDQGQVGPSDLRAISSYYATMRNLGGELIRRGGEGRESGLAVVATAADISRLYGLQRGEAHLDLVDQLGSDRTRWPAPLRDDPILLTKVTSEGGKHVTTE